MDLKPSDLHFKTGAIQALYRKAVENGYPDSYDDELYFYAASGQARAKSDDPPKLFIWLLKNGTKANVSDESLQSAKEVIQSNQQHFRDGLVSHLASKVIQRPDPPQHNDPQKSVNAIGEYAGGFAANRRNTA